MAEKQVFNPLDKKNLGTSVADALIIQTADPLGELASFKGAGIYAIYYRGDCPAYAPLAEQNRTDCSVPIYVGKAVPAGARRGGFGLGVDPGFVLFQRLREHTDTIRQVEERARNASQADQIKLEHFFCRYLLVDDIWIPLGEAMMIEQFQPLWNRVIDGFGNHDPGKGRYNQQRSAWDTLHPGRLWADKCQPYAKTAPQILAAIGAYFAEIGF
jgi:hypothetical protein